MVQKKNEKEIFYKAKKENSHKYMIMIKMIIFLLIFLFSSKPFYFVYAQEVSLRELLVNSKNTLAVIPIDDYHTHVFPEITKIGFPAGFPTKEFTQELIAACDTKFEIKTIDPLTGKETWQPYDEKSNIYIRSVQDKLTKENITVFGSRCIDKFEITTIWYEKFNSRIIRSSTYSFIVNSFIIKHSTKQPWVYKHGKVPPIEKVSFLPDGEIESLDPTAPKRGFFSKLLDLDRPGSIPVFLYIATLCKKENGKPRAVIYEKGFREVPISKGYEYMVSSMGGKEWYFACESQHPFVVKGIYITKPAGAGVSTSFNSLFISNRGLEGIKFIPLEENISSFSSENQTTVEVEQKQAGSPPQDIQEKLAVDVAFKKMNLYKVVGLQEYVGLYNGQDDKGCNLVTIIKQEDKKRKRAKEEMYNYRICNGIIVNSSETPFESLPSDIDIFIQKIAKVAQKFGTAEADYQGYLVKANALRDKDQCSVEIKIFKDINLMLYKIVNSCQ